MKNSVRLLALAVLALGAMFALPQSAQAATGCSANKTIPGVSIKYQACDHQNTKAQWVPYVHVVNNHGTNIGTYSQLKLRIGSTDRIRTERGYYIHTGTSYFDPYGGSGTTPQQVIYIGGYPYRCTPGHTYFPSVRMRLASSKSWGPWAGAGKFSCAG